ncbi:hypothetical protein GBA52_017627 [Prunus armeniaca]|nr:hypothetical protein GBA52_017627 [Prunus armeniaca]
MRDDIFQKVHKVMSLFKQCTTMKEVKQTHGHIIRNGVDQNPFVLGKIISFCAVSERGDMNYAASFSAALKTQMGFYGIL